MKINRNKHTKGWKQQRGMTLIELLVAGVISLIAASGMVLVMASTLGTGSQTIQMARLTQEMRTAMQIMSRELRRANYHSTYLYCYGDVGCLTSPSVDLADKIGPIGITGSVDSNCLLFWYDRLQPDGIPLPKAAWQAAAFRRAANADLVGKIQMTTTDTSPNCGAPHDHADWVDITDPEIIDVLTFNVSDAASFVEVFNADLDSQNVAKIALTMTAKLKDDASVRSWIQTNTNASRELTEFVSVRNNTTFEAP